MSADSAPGDGREESRYGRSRRRLAEAAVREFERRGFAATTVEDIAGAAGYSPRTFFRQFPTKGDAVFFDLPDILSPLRRLVDRPPPDPWAAVCAVLLENSAHWEASGPELAQSRTRLIHREPDLYLRFLQLADEWEDVIARVFAGPDREPDLPGRVRAAAVVGACRIAMRVWSSEPGPSLPDLLRRGLGVIEAARAPGG